MWQGVWTRKKELTRQETKIKLVPTHIVESEMQGLVVK